MSLPQAPYQGKHHIFIEQERNQTQGSSFAFALVYCTISILENQAQRGPCPAVINKSCKSDTSSPKESPLSMFNQIMKKQSGTLNNQRMKGWKKCWWITVNLVGLQELLESTWTEPHHIQLKPWTFLRLDILEVQCSFQAMGLPHGMAEFMQLPLHSVKVTCA